MQWGAGWCRIVVFPNRCVLYLDHLGVESLAHLGSSMSQEHRAVFVDVN